MSDLTINPNSALTDEPIYATYVEQYENGTEQRRARHADEIRKFHLVYTNRSAAQYAAMLAFFQSKKGRLTAFTWTNPNDSVEYTVRFDTDQLAFQRSRYNLWNWEFDLIEVK